MAKLTDVEFIKAEEKWPNWPYLPMKRRRDGEEPEFGSIISGSLFSIRKGYFRTLPKTLPELLALPTWEYGSIEAMLADGWLID